MVKTCCVRWCNSEAYAGCGISFFCFPKNENLQRWLEVIPFKKQYSRFSFICSKHFKNEDIIIHKVKATLKPDAVPSIFPVQLNRKVNILSNITLRAAQKNVQHNVNKCYSYNPSKPSSTNIMDKENSEPTPGTSLEPPLKKARHELEIEVAKKFELQHKVKSIISTFKETGQ
ncbi:hypothetical protein ACJJTC_011647 [Scirpophaga incertulas]